MACIIKTPSVNSKGVISFTNIEYSSQIKKNKKVLEAISDLKKDWIICYHPNWQDLSFENNGLFDVVICNKESFAFSENSKNKLLIDTSSNRMAPSDFKFSNEKKWDFCHVSRYQKSKNIEGFFRVVKEAFSLKNDLTGILIISVKNAKEMKNIRKLYEKMFTFDEKKNFEFVTLSYDLPFPLSKKVLAHFYSHSKVTLNTHLNEPHGRVVGYALACALPIVGYKDISFMVEEKYRVEPYFYITDNEEKLSKLLVKAINYTSDTYDQNKHSDLGMKYSETQQAIFLQKKLQDKFDLDNMNWNLHELDERLSTHYYCSHSSNTFNASILQLLEVLSSKTKTIVKYDEAEIAKELYRNKNMTCVVWSIINNLKRNTKRALYLLIKKGLKK